MDFKSYLQSSAEEINQEIESFFVEWERKVEGISSKLVPLDQPFVESNRGGKRLRGVLVKLGYALVGAKYTSEILKPAAALEIFQTSVLAHDDIIDLSPLRRGKPTLYKALGGDHRAISHTIALADIGFFLASQLISDSGFPDNHKNRAISIFNKMVINTGLGELLDVELPYLNEERRESDVLAIHRLKTAHYTIVYPLSVGVALGGAKEKLLQQIEEFGESLGIAFQIQDDILGVFGDEKTLGKSVTSDIEEGKNTLLITEALKNANDEQKGILDKYYGKGKIGEDELEQIKKVFVDTGALDYSQKKAKELVGKAKGVISSMEISEEHKKLLNEMADFLVNREK